MTGLSGRLGAAGLPVELAGDGHLGPDSGDRGDGGAVAPVTAVVQRRLGGALLTQADNQERGMAHGRSH